MSVHAFVETENGADVWYEDWYLHAGTSSHVYMATPWDRFTNVTFYEPGIYTLAYIVEWIDETGDWRTTERLITIEVVCPCSS